MIHFELITMEINDRDCWVFSLLSLGGYFHKRLFGLESDEDGIYFHLLFKGWRIYHRKEIA